ncbi:hypothetical protein BU15DRAFT_68192 [Melanogaster broomeanus]|nr:hypothetical protein BU15DRAFT_68192 [Melanogaster broomeanus]
MQEMVLEDSGPINVVVVAAARRAARCALMQEMVMEDKGPTRGKSRCARSGSLYVDAGDGDGGRGTHTRRVMVHDRRSCIDVVVVAAAHGVARCALMQEMVLEDSGPT